jgi:hypothetical protein
LQASRLFLVLHAIAAAGQASAAIRARAKVMSRHFGTGGRDRTHADAVLETAALPLSYTGIGTNQEYGTGSTI